ncbi:unnamed protein product [Diatraea saccharalis]|uniref:Ig-like domain-containing protein n=1 Tax=Diatraea saccharalis TaxID=40085 RepID=A0A9N9WJT1_9NEOP|nr:unnamed protein product [Diatraea saccharalis]
MNKAEIRRRRNVNEKWEFETDDDLEYLTGHLTRSGGLGAVYQSPLEGALVTLACTLCVAPDERNLLRWLRSQSLESPFELMVPKYHMVVQDNGDLTIHGARLEDSGVYQCSIGNSVGGIVILEVIDSSHGFSVVKPLTTRGVHPTPSIYIQMGNIPLLVYTAWSPWSECSVCGKVGRRRRYGTCLLKINEVVEAEEINSLHKKDVLSEKSMQLLEAFPDGIPCQSRHLPQTLRNIANISQRRNEIMLGLCKVKCTPSTIFEVRSTRGVLLERANNNDGVYSLWQGVPMPAPKFRAEIVFAVRDEPLNITCPGLSLRDIPVCWRVGTKTFNPRTVDRETGGRVHLNARDQLVFSTVNCWQRDVLLGTVKLITWEGTQLRWNHHVLLVVLLSVAVITLRILDKITRDKRRSLGMM